MKLELKIVKSKSGFDVRIQNKTNKDKALTAWGVSSEGIEDIELQLTNVVAQLYAYRKEHEND